MDLTPSNGNGPVPQKVVTAFICVNCARPGAAMSSRKPRPAPPAFDWPAPAEEVLVPCAGRLQPELIMKAFEAGASFVCLIACQDDNCHYAEGCLRARRRLDYVRGLLDQIGLGGQRLAMFQLPGSAQEDLDVGEGRAVAARASDEEFARQVRSVCEEVVARLAALTPSPLYTVRETEEEVQAVEGSDDNED